MGRRMPAALRVDPPIQLVLVQHLPAASSLPTAHARTTSRGFTLAGAATAPVSRAGRVAAHGYAPKPSPPSLLAAAFEADRRREERGTSSISGFAAAHASLPASEARFSRRRAVCNARPSRQLLHATRNN